ncbi:MAG TPA: TonB-dependent siderophore receptor [Bryobacteraceae bacterium]|nr:TonB-dependent siderophore receptor [Bryobacteraceae bacterium]
MAGRLFRQIIAASVILIAALAQQITEPFQGRVVDPSLAPVEGARITVRPIGGTSGVSAVTGKDGGFGLDLEAGSYTLTVAKEGFVDFMQGIDHPRQSRSGPDVILQIAPMRGAVTVFESADYAAWDTMTATRTLTPLRDVPQSITVIDRALIRDQMMMSIGDVVRYVPGVTAHQGENNRDQVIIRGNSSTADFFLNGVRDDVPYYRDLYNLERVEALKGPNAMIFGRGGGGGVINRVMKEAGFTPLREITLQGGSFRNKRFAADLDQPLGEKAALRWNAMYENSGSFRNYVDLQRYGINPTLSWTPGERTRLSFAYEHFHDQRVGDRGIPSFAGRPAEIPIATFFGNPKDSPVKANVNLGSAAVEHQSGSLGIRNRMLFGGYDRFYQNYVPGAVSADQTRVALSAYNNATRRLNFFNQTDVNYTAHTGRVRHHILSGIEIGRQFTDNFRNTGYFYDSVTSIAAAYENPTIGIPIRFRQSVSDADNHIGVNVGAGYLQDQIDLSRYAKVVAGVRFDHFDLRYHNNRNGENLRRIDNLISPRLGMVIKPMDAISVYGNYSVSYLPSSGDQFASLTTITQQMKPEKFSNYETGIKWDLRRSLSLTTAVYRLDRTNTRATDPNDPTRIVQTGSQRSQGFELGGNGSITRSWRIAGGYAYQDAFVTSATTAARTGAQVAQVPHHGFSLWNNYQILKRLGAGLGILNRSDMFAAIDNTVKLPGYTRADAAVFVSLTEKMRLQMNVENVFNRRYYMNADSNTNISPGFPRAVRVGLTARF